MTTKRLMVYDNPLDPEIQSVELAGETPDGDFSVTRDLSVGRDANITRNVDINGTLDVAGATTLRAAVSVLGASLNVSNNVVAGSDVTSGNDVTAVRDIAASRDLRAARDLAVTRNVQVDGNAAVVGALQATTFGIGAIATPRGTRAAIPDLPAFTDPPTAGEMATLRTTINTLLSYLRVTPGNGMIDD